MTTDHPYIQVLQQYEAFSNQHDVNACVALFMSDGCIVMSGETYQGLKALRDAHEYDEGSNTLVRFSNFEIDGNVVRCTFWSEHALSRVLETGGISGKAEFNFHEDKIQKFIILPPEDAERKRVMGKVAPVLQWLRENHPDAVAKWKGFDRAAGEAISNLADLWQKHSTEN